MRRQVTVLFCDLVGATALSGRLDPEDLGEVLEEYRGAVAAVIEQYGGRLHPTLGDGLMASWGYPRAAEDDAVRAVTAGLVALSAVRDITAPNHDRLLARAGIHTGVAVISDINLGGNREIGNIVGETPNLAARLQTVADTDTLVISESSLEMVRGHFEVRELGPQDLRGVERSLRLFQVLRSDPGNGWVSDDRSGARAARIRSDRDVLIGRQREQEVLAAAWHAAEAGASRVKAIVGDAGMGKSALAEWACRLAMEGAGSTAILRCASVQAGNAFYPLRRLLERRAGIGVGDGLDERRQRLVEFSRCRPAFQSPEALGLLAAMLGLPPGSGIPPVELLHERRRERTLDLLLTFLDELGERPPFLLVIEDAHWADPSTQELLARLIERGPRPATLVLAVTRAPEQLPIAPDDLVQLGPLSDDEVLRVIKQLAPELSDDLRQAVVERADGVPLFAVEVVRLLAVSGPADRTWLPPRLHDLLVARLDQRPAERDLAQLIAVLGAAAPYSQIRKVAGTLGDLRDQLDRLVAAGILRREGPEQDPVFRFTHVLLRDAAYETLLRSRRRVLHSAVATVLRRDMPIGTVLPNVVAHHLQAAGEIAASLPFWWEAAQMAAGVAAHREVVAHLQHVLDLLPETGGESELDEVEVLSTLVASLEVLEGYTSPNVVEVHKRALDLVMRGYRPLRPGLLWPLWAYHHVRGEPAAASALSTGMWEQVRSTSGPERAMAAVMSGHDNFERGELADALTLFDVARRHQVEFSENPHDLPASASMMLGITQWLRGARSAGVATVRAAVRRADALSPPTGPFTRAFVHSYAAWWSLVADDPVSAEMHAACSVESAQSGGYSTWLAASTMHAACARARRGEPAAAVPTLEALLEAWRQKGAELFRPVFLRWLAEARWASGDEAGALASLDEGIAHVSRYGGRIHEPELHRLRASLLRSCGRADDAVVALRTASDLAAQQGALSLQMNALADLVAVESRGRAAARDALAAVLRRITADPSDRAGARARRLSGVE